MIARITLIDQFLKGGLIKLEADRKDGAVHIVILGSPCLAASATGSSRAACTHMRICGPRMRANAPVRATCSAGETADTYIRICGLKTCPNAPFRAAGHVPIWGASARLLVLALLAGITSGRLPPPLVGGR